jgi:hypothetical protein
MRRVADDWRRRRRGRAGLNGVEGAKYLYKEVLTALTTPTPVTG